MKKVNQRYVFGNNTNQKDYFYVKNLDSSESAWISKKLLKSFVAKLKVKILELIHRNS